MCVGRWQRTWQSEQPHGAARPQSFFEPTGEPPRAQPSFCEVPHHGPYDRGGASREINKYGETPPTRWTKVELKCRLRELKEEHLETTDKPPRSFETEYQVLVKKLNMASKLKNSLVEFCRNELKMSVQANETMSGLQRRAMDCIGQSTRPDGQDPVGFGKHAGCSYLEIATEHVSYGEWVKTTAKEERDCNPRLLRLAAWLEDQDRKTTPRKPTRVRAKGKDAESSAPSGSTVGANSSAGTLENENRLLLMQMVESVKNLTEEVKDLGGDRRRKKNPEDSESHFSMVSVPKED